LSGCSIRGVWPWEIDSTSIALIICVDSALFVTLLFVCGKSLLLIPDIALLPGGTVPHRDKFFPPLSCALSDPSDYIFLIYASLKKRK
jgi:hypothetical protein